MCSRHQTDDLELIVISNTTFSPLSETRVPTRSKHNREQIKTYFEKTKRDHPCPVLRGVKLEKIKVIDNT